MSGRFLQAAVMVVAVLATALLAGVFGDWAHTIMPGLAATDDRTFLTAFQALDRAILNPLFLLTFLVAPLATGLAAVLSRRGRDRAILPWVVVAFGLLAAGFVITGVVHEPLNTIVRGAGDPAAIADPAAVRAAFDESRWGAWHLVRTLATTVALGCLAWALVLHGRSSAHDTPSPTTSRGSAAAR